MCLNWLHAREKAALIVCAANRKFAATLISIGALLTRNRPPPTQRGPEHVPKPCPAFDP
jgi:hypothetical protein